MCAWTRCRGGVSLSGGLEGGPGGPVEKQGHCTPSWGSLSPSLSCSPRRVPRPPGALPSPLGPLHRPLPRLLLWASPPDPPAPWAFFPSARQTWCPSASLLGQLHAHGCPPPILAQDRSHRGLSLLACCHVYDKGLSRPRALWPGGAAERGTPSFSQGTSRSQESQGPHPLVWDLALGCGGAGCLAPEGCPRQPQVHLSR